MRIIAYNHRPETVGHALLVGVIHESPLRARTGENNGKIAMTNRARIGGFETLKKVYKSAGSGRRLV